MARINKRNFQSGGFWQQARITARFVLLGVAAYGVVMLLGPRTALAQQSMSELSAAATQLAATELQVAPQAQAVVQPESPVQTVPIFHTVQAGETLRGIAEAYGYTWETVAAVNRMTNPNVIEVGQVLQIGGEIPADFVAAYTPADYSLAEFGIVETAETVANVEGTEEQAAGNSAAGTAAPNVPVLPGAYQATDVVHIVQSGDTLGQIAARYGVPLHALIQVNNIENPSIIHVGQSIVIAGPAIPPAPEAPIAEGKVILVSISQQYLWAYEDGVVQVESFVTSGRPRADTPRGTFHILVKYTDYKFISPYPEGHEFYYNSQMSNYSLRYTWDGYHIHDAPWRSDYGPGTNVPHVDSLGRHQTGSIGCVNVTAGAMERLFHWAEVGTPIVVVD